MTKSSKIIIALLVIILIAVLGIGGYVISYLNAETEENVVKTENTITNSTENSLTEKDEITNNSNTSKEDIVTDLYNKQVTKVDENGIQTVYTFRLPKLNLSSAYANEINNEIAKLEINAKNFVSKINNGDHILGDEYVYGFEYNYAINDDIVSIIIFEDNESDADDAIVYNINKTTGKKVEKTELLKKANIEESNFQNTIYSIIENNEIFYSNVDHAYLTEKADCTLDKCDLLYLDDGDLYVTVKISGTDISGKSVINVRTGWPLNG